jgi:hypothetical protein
MNLHPPCPIDSADARPAFIAASGEDAQLRANIRNRNTRLAYAPGVGSWHSCEHRRVPLIEAGACRRLHRRADPRAIGAERDEVERTRRNLV